MAGIPVEWCVGAREIGEPRLSPDGALLGVVVSVGGVAGIDLYVVADASATTRRVVHTPAPRAGRGLGGGGWTWTADGDAIVYSAADGNLWWQSLDGGPSRSLTDHGPERGAQAPAVSGNGAFVVYVLDQSEVWSVAIDGSGGRRLDDGSADFCFDPVVHPDGATVLWQAWNLPDMPWDSSRSESLDLSTGAREHVQPIGALQQPRPMPDGRILCVRDDCGWANLWLDGAPLVTESFEHAGPTWGLGQRSFAVSPDGDRIAFTRNERGFGRLCVLELAGGQVVEIARGVHGQLSWSGDHVAALRTGARTPPQVVLYDVAHDWARRIAVVGPEVSWADASLVEPELVVVVVDGDEPGRPPVELHARLYRADPGSDGTRLICWLHGGPTDQWQVTFMPRLAYWRSLGWNVLVPDHRGSTGHGREYQQALRGQWGVLDVQDTIAMIRAAHDSGWGRPDRTVLIGGSAGGFTVLNVLERAAAGDPLAAAGILAFPVCDLDDLAERSHRFERHYTDSLVGPAGSDLMRERSPIWFAHRILCPILVFHGEVDPVVPVEQSRVLVERMRTAGSEVELIVYPGEGHGFRSPEHQLDEYAHTAAFLTRHVR